MNGVADRAPGDLDLLRALVDNPLLTADEAARVLSLPLPAVATADADDDPPPSAF